jgi:DNA-binding MarR family transcriptional regulator
MAKKKVFSIAVVDQMAKAMLIAARTVDYVLESRAVDAATDKPLSSSKTQVLRLLALRSGQTSSQVARYLGVSKPAVSQIIDAMVRSKLVTRKTSKSDRREVNLTLTEKGKTLNNVIRHQQRTFIRSALREANGAMTSRWITSLTEIASALGKADKAFEDHCMQCGAHEDGSCVLVGGGAKCHFLAYEPRAALTAKKKTTKKRKTKK